MADTKRCPYCGEEILAVAKKCKHCGEWLDKEEPKKEEKKMVACPVCGEDIEEGTKVCPYCHEHTGFAKAQAPTSRQQYAPQQPAHTENDSYDEEEGNVGWFNYYYIDVFLKHYADFKGKLGRKRFWLAYLFNALCATTLSFVSAALFGIPAILFFVYQAAVLVPSIAFTVRRLHDTGKSGWWVLLGLIPFAGQIALLVLLCMPGEEDSGNARAETKDYVIIGAMAVLIVVGGILGNKKLEKRRMMRNNTEVRSGSTQSDASFGNFPKGNSVSDDEAINMLTEFYEIYLNNKYEYNELNMFVRKHCSKNLLEKAEYWEQKNKMDEEQGYLPSEPTLVSIFQPSSDFNGRDTYPESSSVHNIEKLGNSDYYRVQFIDCGYRAEVVVSVIEEDGTIKIDDVKDRWIED